MKKNMLKFISATLAAIVSAGCFGTYAMTPLLDYEVEPGVEQISQSDSTATVASVTLLDYSVEDGPDINQTVATEDEPSASLMAEIVMFRGKGTEAEPYLISSVDELMSIATWVNNGVYTNAYYKLENDIDLGGAEWVPIGDYQDSAMYTYAFKGTFDGNGKTVSNFKITKPQVYAGFFGLANNATIKNLTIENINIDVSYAANKMYVGALVATIRAAGDGETAEITNCHVKGASINAVSNLRIYGSGHSGYLHSSDNAEFILRDCSVDAKVNFTVNDTDTSVNSERSMIRAGGLIGYVGITDAKMSVSDSSANATVITMLEDASANLRNDIHVGGFAGDFSLSSENQATRSRLVVDSCYSTNMVYADADGDTYAGGFSGYFVSSASDVSVSNCHTTSAVYSLSSRNSSYIGGFASIAGIAGVTPIGTINMSSIYSAGNVIDTGSASSCGGKFVGYIEGDPAFKNIFVMEDSVLNSKQGTTKGSKELKGDEIPGTVFDADTASDVKNYVGFDVDIWKDGTSPYTYPVLSDNEFVSGKYGIYVSGSNPLFAFKTDFAYGDTPVVPDDDDAGHYVFSHWSLQKSGSDIMDGSTKVTSDIIIYPVYTDEYKSYDITFMANGEIFSTASLKYNSTVVFPDDVPTKPADKLFRYAFSHWSATEDGSAVNTNITVKGKQTFYAVFKKIETGVWDGVSDTPFVLGNGSEASPYEIADAYQLSHLSKTVNDGTAASGTYYILTKDIDLGGFEWTPIGTEEYPFEGHINGNGYSVYNFEITDESVAYAGLFGYTSNADISKLEVSGFNIDLKDTDRTLKYYAGAVAAYASSIGNEAETRISECYADGEISIEAKFAYVGGLVGQLIDSDFSYAYIDNSYSNVDISVTTSSNSTAGGIVGKFDSQNQGISCVDKCYAVGNIQSESDVAAYGGGIAGFLFNDEDWAEVSGEDVVNLLADEDTAETGAIRNSFYKANTLKLSLGHTSYGGPIYGYKNSAASVLNCGYDDVTLKITASTVASDKNVSKIKGTSFTDKDYVAKTFGFDFDNVWDITDGLPILKIFNQIKNVFRINEYKFDDDENVLNVELKICYRDVESYIVLLGMYDERGKMIGFKSTLITNPAELTTLEFEVTGTENAVNSTLSVVNPKTLALIEAPVTLTK